jgi:hypothetical protein
MPKKTRRQERTSFAALVPTWFESLATAVRRDDPECPEDGEPMFVANCHLGKHTVRPENPPAPGDPRGITRRIDCARGDTCKGHAASVAIVNLSEATLRGPEEVRRIAKAVARVRDEARRIQSEYLAELQDYLPTMQAQHERHEALGQLRITLAHDAFCRRPTLVAEHLAHLVNHLEGTDEVMLLQLPPWYREPFGKNERLALLDIVSVSLFDAFTDAEIAAMIPDGLSRGDDRQRVSNRRLKLKGSRVEPG